MHFLKYQIASKGHARSALAGILEKITQLNATKVTDEGTVFTLYGDNIIIPSQIELQQDRCEISSASPIFDKKSKETCQFVGITAVCSGSDSERLHLVLIGLRGS